ncbi:MAG: phage tail protein [Desulfobacteraceae bacterium]|nr:phage tail protein [Desulfobacteraceae bacterium]
MADPLLGQVTMFGGTYAPKFWGNCDGQIIEVSQNTALFSLLGDTFGGDGRINFGLPDMRGRIPVHVGQAPGMPTYWNVGMIGGVENVHLSPQQIPSHSHGIAASTTPGNAAGPSQTAVFSQAATNMLPYGPFVTKQLMSDEAIGSTGGGESHENVMPSTVVRFIIALQGTYPRRP